MEKTIKYLRNASLFLGAVTLVYGMYLLVAVASNAYAIYINVTEKDFLYSFFMGAGILSFGLFLDTKIDPLYKNPSFKSTGIYRMAVTLTLSIMCIVMSFVIVSYLP